VVVVLAMSECCICCFSRWIEVVFVWAVVSCAVVAYNGFAVYRDLHHPFHQRISLRVFGIESLALAMVFGAEDLLVDRDVLISTRFFSSTYRDHFGRECERTRIERYG
jgi:hypothetical protein